MFTEVTAQKLMDQLPDGYEIVTEGKLREGDIRWNKWCDCWNLEDTTTAPKHNIVIGDPVSNFSGVCRKIKPKGNEKY